MPTSANIFDNDYLGLVNLVKPKNILDVGPGEGKYHRLTRLISDCTLDAIEVDDSYVDTYKLRDKYNQVFVSDIKEFCSKNSRMRYDIVVFGDVLEHLFRSDAMDVLDFVLYRAKYVVVMWPNNYWQDDWEGHESEAHKSNFTLKDFSDKGFDVIFFKKRRYGNERMSFCILQGYMNNEEIEL